MVTCGGSLAANSVSTYYSNYISLAALLSSRDLAIFTWTSLAFSSISSYVITSIVFFAEFLDEVSAQVLSELSSFAATDAGLLILNAENSDYCTTYGFYFLMSMVVINVVDLTVFLHQFNQNRLTLTLGRNKPHLSIFT